jgi:hypothetical protein
MFIFVLCHIVVSLPLVKNPFAVQLNTNKSNNNITQQPPQSTVFKPEDGGSMLV